MSRCAAGLFMILDQRVEVRLLLDSRLEIVAIRNLDRSGDGDFLIGR
jgi:hypothetical protein